MTRVPFAKPDGEDIFNDLAHLAFANLYGAVDRPFAHSISREKMEKAFGLGERRPLEHEAVHSPVYVWRFQQGNTFIRVECIPPAGQASSYILVEAPQGAGKSSCDDAIAADVMTFVSELQATLA